MRRVSSDNVDSSRIILGLLDAVEQDRAHSQRYLASELGIALGLVNAYLKRCMKKGLVKVRQAPARRFAYYLTPQGFAEKSRLTVEYLSNSFGFFREAKSDCSELYRAADARGVRKILLLGHSDLAEIAALCAIEQGMDIVGLVDINAEGQFMGRPIYRSLEAVAGTFDAVLVTDVRDARGTSDAAIASLGADRVLVPNILRVRVRQQAGAA